MNRLARLVLIIASIAYPLVVVFGLLVFHAPPRVLGLSLVFILVVNFIANSGDARKKSFEGLRLWVVSIILTALVALIFITDNAGLVKLYPVLMNTFLLAGFAWTLYRPPTMIFRFASMQDKTLSDSPNRPSIEAYCRTVTQVWCAFFLCNALAAMATAFWASELVWSVYNGVVSYVLIGILLGGELIIRRFRKKA